MKVKVSEAEGQVLDWMVEKCEYDAMPFVKAWVKERHLAGDVFTQASTDWSQGGPIIEREEIRIAPDGRNDWTNRPPISWGAAKYWSDGRSDWWFGPTPLIAAMRCYVTSKLGDEVDVPEVLCEKP